MVKQGDFIFADTSEDLEGVSNMCDVAQRLEDRGIEKGIKEGISLGGNQMIYSLVEDKSISMEKGAQKLGISVEKLRANMINAPFHFLSQRMSFGSNKHQSLLHNGLSRKMIFF